MIRRLVDFVLDNDLELALAGVVALVILFCALLFGDCVWGYR